MEIFIKGELLEIELEAEDTFGSIFERVEENLEQRDMVVSGFSINSEPVTEEIEKMLWDEQPDVDIRIDVQAKEATEILAGALGEAEKDLPKLTGLMHKVAVSLQSGLKQEAYAIFQQCLSTWRQIISLLQITQETLQYQPDEIVVRGRNIDQINEELVMMLKETKEAMEADDLVNISDLIEYELCEKIEEEREIIQRLIEYAGERSGLNRL
jgi:hypothetical protein